MPKSSSANDTPRRCNCSMVLSTATSASSKAVSVISSSMRPGSMVDSRNNLLDAIRQLRSAKLNCRYVHGDGELGPKRAHPRRRAVTPIRPFDQCTRSVRRSAQTPRAAHFLRRLSSSGRELRRRAPACRCDPQTAGTRRRAPDARWRDGNPSRCCPPAQSRTARHRPSWAIVDRWRSRRFHGPRPPESLHRVRQRGKRVPIGDPAVTPRHLLEGGGNLGDLDRPDIETLSISRSGPMSHTPRLRRPSRVASTDHRPWAHARNRGPPRA